MGKEREKQKKSTLPKSRKRDDFRFKSRGIGMSRVSSGKQNNPAQSTGSGTEQSTVCVRTARS